MTVFKFIFLIFFLQLKSFSASEGGKVYNWIFVASIVAYDIRSVKK